MKKYVFTLSVSLISLAAFGQDALVFCKGGVPAGRSYPGDLVYPNGEYPHFHCFKGKKVQASGHSGGEIVYLQATQQCKWSQAKVNALAGGKEGNLDSMVNRYNPICGDTLTAP